MLTSLLLVALLALAYFLGWKHKDNWDWIRAMVLKATHPDVLQEQPKSSIIEPNDETFEERIRREQKELVDKLNPR